MELDEHEFEKLKAFMVSRLDTPATQAWVKTRSSSKYQTKKLKEAAGKNIVF